MRTRYFCFCLLVAAIFILGGAFTARSDATKEEQQGYKKQMEKKLNAINKQIKELEKKSTDLKAEAKTEFKKETKNLRSKERAAKQKWQELKRASAQEWDKAKLELDKAVETVGKAYEKVMERFKEK